VLVDSSVWIAHFRRRNPRLSAHLEGGEVECHPFIIGELACGSLPGRREVLELLAALPQVVEADHAEVLSLVDFENLFGCGLGWVDAHLLASTLMAKTTLWTADRRLREQAKRLGVVIEAS